VQRVANHHLLLVSGPPAAGKSTWATALAAHFAVPLVSRDSLKEVLFDTLGPGDRTWSRQLGRASFGLLHHVMALVMATGGGLVVENAFHPVDAGWIGDLAMRYRYRCLEVVMAAPATVLLQRFRLRARSDARHPGHVDQDNQEELAMALDSGIYATSGLGLGPVFVVDTGQGPWPSMTDAPVPVGRDPNTAPVFGKLLDWINEETHRR
jgi:predicted kinase